MGSLDAYFASQLASRKKQGLLRERVCVEHNTDGVISTASSHLLDFASNDYLGLRNHPDVLQAWANGLAQYGAGSGASPLVTGYYSAHQLLEHDIARLLNRQSALLFSSGFAANQALCRALFSQGGVLVADKLMHASFIDGALASKAMFKRFKHNDMEDLEKTLKRISSKHENNALPKIIASESVFSMDGDTPDIGALTALAQRYDYSLMLDDAHGLGVLGSTGMGAIEAFSLTDMQAPIVMGTFGKALGTGGAFIAGSHELISFLVNFARDYIYSTSMPPAQAAATRHAISMLQTGKLTQALQANIDYFKRLVEHHGLSIMPSNSAIQLIQVGDPQRVTDIGNELKRLGIWVGIMRAPTVAKGTDRLRITLRANHTNEDIEAIVDALLITLNHASTIHATAKGKHGINP